MIDVPERRLKFLYSQLRGGQPNLSRNSDNNIRQTNIFPENQ